MIPAAPPAGLRIIVVGRADLAASPELRSAGLDATEAASLPSALEALRAHPGSVVVVDGAVLAGRMSDACGALRTAGASAVVAMIPPDRTWDADRALARGVDASIAEPTAPGVLAAVMRRIAETARAPAPPADGRGRVESAGDRDAPAWLDSALGEAAVLHRGIESPDRILDQIHSTFVRRADAERCSILLCDRRRTSLRLRRSNAVADVALVEPVPVGRGLAGHVARSGTPLVVTDVAHLPAELGAPTDAPERSYRTASCLLLPMRGAEDVVGVVCLADRRTGEPFRDEDVPPLRFLADQAGQAVENALKFRELQELASVDELTGLANRRQFQRALEREVQRARRYGRQLTLCLLDLDHFKQFNDRWGHQAGDRALATVGDVLRTALREVDVVARYGGEEFGVILPETAARPSGSASNPFPFLERLRRRIEASRISVADDVAPVGITVSGGVACFPDDADTVEELVREADRSLYVSKSRGRNTLTYRGRRLAE